MSAAVATCHFDWSAWQAGLLRLAHNPQNFLRCTSNMSNTDIGPLRLYNLLDAIKSSPFIIHTSAQGIHLSLPIVSRISLSSSPWPTSAPELQWFTKLYKILAGSYRSFSWQSTSISTRIVSMRNNRDRRSYLHLDPFSNRFCAIHQPWHTAFETFYHCLEQWESKQLHHFFAHPVVALTSHSP